MKHIENFAAFQAALVKDSRTYLVYDFTCERSEIKAAFLHKALTKRFGKDASIKHVDTALFVDVPAQLKANFFWLDKSPTIKSVTNGQAHFFRGANLSFAAGRQAPGPANLNNIVPDWFTLSGLIVEGLGDSSFEHQILKVLAKETEFFTTARVYGLQKSLSDASKGVFKKQSLAMALVDLFTNFEDRYTAVLDKVAESAKAAKQHAIATAIGSAEFVELSSGAIVAVFSAPYAFKDDAAFAAKGLSVDAVVCLSYSNFHSYYTYSVVRGGKLTIESLKDAVREENNKPVEAVNLKAVIARLKRY